MYQPVFTFGIQKPLKGATNANILKLQVPEEEGGYKFKELKSE